MGKSAPNSPLPPPVYGGRKTVRIGLLGGSFNPAHGGHLHISRLALRGLGLDEVWWLVSPQNPLKSASDMAPLTARLASARSVAQADFRIRVSDLESRLGLRYTVDTLRALKVRHPGAVFVWLMGADNLGQIHRWKRWTEIFKIAPIAVFDRSSYSYTALASPAAVRFSRSRVSARHLVAATPPAWAFLFRERHGASATEERARGHWKT